LSTDAARQIGYTAATDYASAVSSTCDWLRSMAPEGWQMSFPVLASYAIPLFDYDAEDQFHTG